MAKKKEIPNQTNNDKKNTKILQVTLTADEKKMLESKAEEIGITVAGYIKLMSGHLELPTNKIERDDVKSRPLTTQARVNPDFFEMVQLKAKSIPMSVSDFIRMVCLHGEIIVKIPNTKK